MWLIDVSDYSLQQYIGRNLPDYAILSHTWGEQEMTFQELQALSIDRSRLTSGSDTIPKSPEQSSTLLRSHAGFAKLELTCRQARADGYSYAWMDTCCIDKTSSAELSESINSMFAWYQASEVCYVYLQDFHTSPMGEPADVRFRRLKACRWFTRGWTLQELLAPDNVVFYDMHWRLVGRKQDMLSDLRQITGIPALPLREVGHIQSYSIAARMSWASLRNTTREEDQAYCLLGIFDVKMPLLYGEGGRKAFRRLQREAFKLTQDESVLA